MPGTAVVGLQALTIASGASTSNVITNLDDSWAISIYSPATFTGTISVQIEPSSSGTNFVTLQSGGTDVTLNTAKAIVINPITFKQLRLISGSAEGQTDVFQVTKTILV